MADLTIRLFVKGPYRVRPVVGVLSRTLHAAIRKLTPGRTAAAKLNQLFDPAMMSLRLGKPFMFGAVCANDAHSACGIALGSGDRKIAEKSEYPACPKGGG